MWNYIKNHKWQGIAFTLLITVSILGSMLTVDRVKKGNKTEAIGATSAMTVVPIYMSLIDGNLINITSFVTGTPQGTNIQN